MSAHLPNSRMQMAAQRKSAYELDLAKLEQRKSTISELDFAALVEQRIRLAQQYRRETIAKILALEEQLKAGISRQHTVTQEGRTLRFTTAQLVRYYAKWSRYYTAQIAHDTKALSALQRPSLRTAVTERAKAMPVLPMMLLGMVLLLGLFAVLEPTLTGLVVKQPKLYSDTVGRTFTENAVWQFTPEQQKAGERITSLKLTGSVEGSGTARVLLDGKIVVEYTLAPIATPVEGASTANTSDNATATAEPTVDSGLTDITGAVVLAKSIEQFTLECVESCTLDIAASDTYALTVEVSGVTLEIDTASYTTEEILAVTPVPANVSAPENVTAENVTANITAANATVENVTVENITANATPMNISENITAPATENVSTENLTNATAPDMVLLRMSLKDKGKNDIESEIEIGEAVGEDAWSTIYSGKKPKHDGMLRKGNYHAILKPNRHIVKEIEVFNLSVENDLTDILDIDDMPETAVPKLSRDKPDWVELYALRPAANYSSATVTLTAKGTKLYKCKDWDFDTRTCGGSWVEHMDLVPGENYTITLDADDPGFGEIPITDAMHLDENYNFISNVYEEVKAADGVWSEQIPEDEYVRATFQQSLSSGNVVNIIARAQQNTESVLEIYVAGTTTLVGSTGTLSESGQQHDIELQNFDTPTSQFDIKVVNNDAAANRWVEFDFIHDQRIQLGPEVFVDWFEPVASGALITDNWTLSNVTGTTAKWATSNIAADLPGLAIAGRNGSNNCDISSGGCVMGLKRSINTTRVMNISVNFTVASAALDSGEYIRVFALNSSGWVNILDATGAALSKTTTLWNSSGNGGFHFDGFNISFSCGQTGANELCRADNITIRLLENMTPTVTGVQPIENISTFSQNTQVNISVNASDDMGNRSGFGNLGVDQVEINVTVPNGTTLAFINMFPPGPGMCSSCALNYSALFNDTSQAGQYNVTFLVNDTVNNENWTVKTRFNITAPGDTEFPNVSYINTSDGFGSGVFGRRTPVNISAYVNDTGQLSFIALNIQVPNGTFLPNITMLNGSIARNTTQQPNNFSIRFNDTSQTGTYILRVLANDTANNMNDTITSRFDVTSVVSFSILTSSIDFGALLGGELQDTQDDTPVPFRVENDGNVPINISINGTSIFNSSATNSSSYQFMCGTAGGGSPTESACNAPAPTTFTNLPLANISIAADKQALTIFDLPWQSTNDSLAVDIRMNVPDDEAGGSKSSVVTLEAVET